MISLSQRPSLACQEGDSNRYSQYASDFLNVLKNDPSLHKLNEIKLKFLLTVKENPGSQAKYVGEKNNYDRIKALKYLKELVDDGYQTMKQLPSQNAAMRGAYCFYVVPNITKSDILAVLKAKQVSDIDSSRKEQLQAFLEKELDETARKAILYLCDHPNSSAQQIKDGTGMSLKRKSLQDKLSGYLRKIGFIDCNKIQGEGRFKVSYYSVAEGISQELVKEILLSAKNDLNTSTSQIKDKSLDAKTVLTKLNSLFDLKKERIETEEKVKNLFASEKALEAELIEFGGEQAKALLNKIEE